MKDAELLAAFEDCSLPSGQWTHESHVRVAWLYASRNDLPEAVDLMRTAIRRYNKATDTPEAIDRGYHETITQAFMRLVFAANFRTGPHESSEQFRESHPELLTKYVLRSYYARDRIMTVEAKNRFVEPDLAPLPVVTECIGENCVDRIVDVDGGNYALIEELTEDQIEQLHALVQQQWWGGRRSLDDVRLMAKHTSLMIGLADDSNQLAGCCRVLTDFAFRATIYDVMVAKPLQGRGLGKILMEAVSNHPRLRRVSMIYLCCEPEMFPFYVRWGFQVHEGNSRCSWMTKVQREEGVKCDVDVQNA